MAKKLIAGPWIGEFGWELFAWQGYIRSLSRHFDKTIIISKSNSSALYMDFADEFLSYTPPPGISDSFFMYNVDIKKCFKEAVEENNLKLDSNTSILLPRRIGNPPFTHFSEKINFYKYNIKPIYKKFGKASKLKYEYVFHIRNRNLRKQDNWGKENWRILKQYLESDNIACIGTKKESEWLEGTVDLRGVALEQLFDILRNTKYVFGPSSGPMHLSSLCGAKHIVWGDQQKSLNRYEKSWNPFQTPVLFLDKYKYHPKPKYVYKMFKEWKAEK